MQGLKVFARIMTTCWISSVVPILCCLKNHYVLHQHHPSSHHVSNVFIWIDFKFDVLLFNTINDLKVDSCRLLRFNAVVLRIVFLQYCYNIFNHLSVTFSCKDLSALTSLQLAQLAQLVLQQLFPCWKLWRALILTYISTMM